MAKHTTVAPEDTRPITQPDTELQERIRLRAYEFYEQRGREPGHDVDDWLQAESELIQKNRKKLAA